MLHHFTPHFELIQLDNIFTVEQSEKSDSRPPGCSKIVAEMSYEDYNSGTLERNLDDYEDTFQEGQPIQDETISTNAQQNITTLQNVSDPSDEATTNPPRLTIINNNNRFKLKYHPCTINTMKRKYLY